ACVGRVYLTPSPRRNEVSDLCFAKRGSAVDCTGSGTLGSHRVAFPVRGVPLPRLVGFSAVPGRIPSYRVGKRGARRASAVGRGARQTVWYVVDGTFPTHTALYL